MDTSTLITVLTGVGGVLGGILGAPIVGKIVEQFFKRTESRGDELAEIRRDQAAAIKAKDAECQKLQEQLDVWQERYYKAHEDAMLAQRDVDYYQRLARISASAGERAEIVARQSLDALPGPAADA